MASQSVLDDLASIVQDRKEELRIQAASGASPMELAEARIAVEEAQERYDRAVAEPDSPKPWATTGFDRLLWIARQIRDKFREGQRTQANVPGFSEDVQTLAEIVDKIDADQGA